MLTLTMKGCIAEAAQQALDERGGIEMMWIFMQTLTLNASVILQQA
ncbi:hypothetical protein [Erwinia psidii]|nr:hypothetical protein [Erwinia psidii]